MSTLFIFQICICLLAVYTGQQVLGATGDLDEACNATSTCSDTTNHVCDTNLSPHKCRIKNGTDCSSHADKCVDGAVCSGPAAARVCVCNTVRATPVSSTGLCAAPPAAGTLGGACTVGTACPATMVCESAVCKNKNGADCTGHDDQCVDGAACTGSPAKVCVCGTGRTPATAQGTCADSGSENIMTSLILIMAAFLASHLA